MGEGCDVYFYNIISFDNIVITCFFFRLCLLFFLKLLKIYDLFDYCGFLNFYYLGIMYIIICLVFNF